MSLIAKFRKEAWINDNAIPTGEVVEFDISKAVLSMTPSQRQKLLSELDKIGGQDLDFLAEVAADELIEGHDGPFTVLVEREEFLAFCETKQLELGDNRYVIADGDGILWGHIFANNPMEVMTKFVYDRVEERVIAAQMIGGHGVDGPWWADLSNEAIEDLEDSLKNANETALDHPLPWGLAVSNELPEWAEEVTASLKL